MISDGGVRYSVQCRYRSTHLEGVFWLPGEVGWWSNERFQGGSRSRNISVLGRRLPQSEKSRRVVWFLEDAFATDLSSKPTSTRRCLEMGQPAQRSWSPPDDDVPSTGEGGIEVRSRPTSQPSLAHAVHT